MFSVCSVVIFSPNYFPRSLLQSSTSPSDLLGLQKSCTIYPSETSVRSRQTKQYRRTIDCTSDRDSALSKWLIARAIEVNRDVRPVQRLTPVPVYFPDRTAPTWGPLMWTVLRPLTGATTTGSAQSEPIPRFLTDCSDELIARTIGLLGRFVPSSEIDYASRIGGPREAATNEQNRTNNRLHPRSRFSALEVADRPRDRGESRRSSGPTPDTHARLFSWPPCAERERELTCGPLTQTELRPLASATTTGHVQPESILGSPTELLGRMDCSDE